MYGRPCQQKLGDQPHHVMADETLPASAVVSPVTLLLYGLFLLCIPFPVARPGWFRPRLVRRLRFHRFLFLLIDNELLIPGWYCRASKNWGIDPPCVMDETLSSFGCREACVPIDVWAFRSSAFLSSG
jgi:hypothetical protein